MVTLVYRSLLFISFLNILLLNSLSVSAQKKSEDERYADFVAYIKSSTGYAIDNEYFTYVRQYGTLEKNFWLYGGRKYKIFCFSASGNIKDLDAHIYDYETNELIAKHTKVHPLGIVDVDVKETRRVKVIVQLQEHYNSLNTKVNVVLAYKNTQPVPPTVAPTTPSQPPPNQPPPTLPVNTSTFTARSLVDELNKTVEEVRIGFAQPNFVFKATGEIKKNSRSLYFLELNNQIFIHISVPQGDVCGPYVTTIPAKWSGGSGAGDGYYYIRFPLDFPCGANRFKDLFIFFDSKTGAYTEKMKEAIKIFMNK